MVCETNQLLLQKPHLYGISLASAKLEATQIFFFSPLQKVQGPIRKPSEYGNSFMRQRNGTMITFLAVALNGGWGEILNKEHTPGKWTPRSPILSMSSHEGTW